MRPSVWRRPLQVGAFLRKEAVDVLRQPRLLLTMVIGPFLIMAAFGLGYRDTPEKMRTLFVVPAGSPMLDGIESYADDIGGYVTFEGTTEDAADARRRLMRDEVDLLVVFPDRPLDTVLGGERATVTVVHTRLDPIEQTAILFASQLGIDQINGEILATIVGGGQEIVRPAQSTFQAADQAVAELEAAVADRDEEATESAIEGFADTAEDLSALVRESTVFLDRIDSAGGGVDDIQATLMPALDELDAAIADARRDQSSENLGENVDRFREVLSTISTNYERLASVDPSILVQPFASQVELAVDGVSKVTDWYAPAAVILMIQQFGVAFGALSFVRERQLGIVDVYRVAPVNATETLVGKYLAYLAIGGALAAALTGLIVAVLDVPIASSVVDVAVVIGLTLFASIGVGFLISLASETDAQAVQYTMVVLLASLFFSGFFLSVGQMEGPARFISYVLPVSYGMAMLRDVMLRGAPIDIRLLLGLIAFGVVAFAISLLGTRRRTSIAR